MISGLKQSVLIVDDQDNWRNLLREILNDEFEVVAAESYAEALDAISKRVDPFHVLVTDMRLEDDQRGNEDGVKLIEHIHNQNDKTNTILLTGYPTIASAKKILKQLDAFDYLEKHPADGSDFNPHDFRRIVEEAAAGAKKSRNRLVFVLMPFAKEYENFYENAIKRIIEEIGLDCRRVDDFFGSCSIMADVFRYIKDAKFILADFSGRNPNVFFEVGISHAIGKTVLFLTQDLKDVPPKLQTIRCHTYESTLAGAARVRTVLESAIQEIQQANYPAFFAARDVAVVPNTCLALMPGTVLGRRTYDDLICVALSDANCSVERADRIFNHNSVLDEIWVRINSAEVIVADLTGRDADVFYLAGLAYGLKKKIIYIGQNEEDVPFDLKAGSHLTYSLDPFSEGFMAQQNLAQLVRDVLN